MGMEITLIINPGSSSKKFALYQGRTRLLDAYVERNENGFEMCTAISGIQQKCELLDKQGFKESLHDFLALAQKLNHITDPTDVTRVVMRVVAPGTFFQTHREINNEYSSRLQAVTALAPLHIPHLIHEIEAIKKFLPNVKIIAASDSAFHSTIKDFVRRYSLPENESKKYDIYRFGYHGLSIASVIKKAARLTLKEASRTIVCHIGSGVSVTAVRDGRSVDTTMGYSPGSGLIMGSRAGDLDAGALLALMQAKNLKPTDAQLYLQTNGGLFGLTGEADLRQLLARRAQGDQVATDAISSFVYHIQKAIGAYVAILGGVDAVIFTATASERNSVLRSLIVENLSGLGISMVTEKNEACLSRDGILSADDSPVVVMVIKTDEANEMLSIGETFSPLVER